MIFHETSVHGARLVELERRGDARGFFARLYCDQEFAAAGLESRMVQANTSLTAQARTLRGMHYQLPPAAEAKLVRCLRGALWDVVLDLRPDSPTFGRWFGVELNAENRLMMYVPPGCAHGFITLQDDVEAVYLVSAGYSPEQERGVRWNDPRFAIGWPVEPAETSAKDASWRDFDPEWHGVERMRGLV
jgi:dTDP-4-dehydrorhamnose 3,5-epimerase